VTSPVTLPLQQTLTKLFGVAVNNALKATGSKEQVGGAWASPATQGSGSSGSSSGTKNSSSGGGGSTSGTARHSSRAGSSSK
jgi:hypothetical protein